MEINGSPRKPWFKNYFQRNYPTVTVCSDMRTSKIIQEQCRGGYLNNPNIDKYNEHGRGNGLRYGVSSMQGWRSEMEDAHCAVVSLGQDRGIWRNISLLEWSFFGVFDGRSGDTASNYCADQLLGAIIYSPEFQEDIVRGIKSGFFRLDNRLRRLPDVGCGKDKSSSTAICALVSPYNIYLAHCGDSKAVISNNGSPTFETSQHVPSSPDERIRIENAGGVVTLTDGHSGLSTVSRSFGDFRYKTLEKNPGEHIITAEPEINVKARVKNDDFLILACNGVWDVMDSYEVCKYVQHLMRLTEDLEIVANSLANTCLYKGSKDSITVIIVALPGAPIPIDRLIYLEKNVDLYIERKIKELIFRDRYSDIKKVIEELQACHIPYLPPGAGIGAKLHLIETVYNEFQPYQTESALSSLVQTSKADEFEEVILY